MDSLIYSTDLLGGNYEQFKQIVENSKDTIKIVDICGRIIYASRSHQYVYGCDAIKYIGKSVFESVHPDDLSGFRSAFEAVVNKNESVISEMRKFHKEGHYIWLEASCSPVVNADGEVQSVIVVTRDIGDRKEYEKNLEYMAYHDFLTGLYNRRKFIQIFENLLINAEERHLKLGVLTMDLDHFKRMNDHLGHDAGDKLLQEFSKRLLACKRDKDLIGRLSGDEFAILIFDILGESEIREWRDRITASLEEPCVLNNSQYNISVSIGSAIFPENGRSVSELMKFADLALYDMKRKGKENI
ncbi:sensor domain-containing diguanylate cyclase [Paenibacillus odorifer]|uniref:PAS domain S-box protein n=1 Tax=Paenibacillus odorifer TaxID=189426 RepID=A0A1R0Y005_9BACL|nr:sensor domain-containing diguanylate cyclase [Paenibacillus odorifer]OMD40688.1 hypothetical protein BSK52_12515 [Paenibacillus odorifer]